VINRERKIEQLNEGLVPLSSRHISMHNARMIDDGTGDVFSRRAGRYPSAYEYNAIFAEYFSRICAKLVSLACQPARIYFLVSSPLGPSLLLLPRAVLLPVSLRE